MDAPTTSTPAVNPGLWLPAMTLCRRELVRFFRQRGRVIGALGTPLVFWLLIGSGMGTSFRPAGAATGSHYRDYFFAGTAMLIVLFTAIFCTISIIEDRREGFLQGVLVAPVPRASIVLGKVLGGAAIAFLHGVFFLALAPLTGSHAGVGQLATAAGVLFLSAFGLTGLGFCFAWRVDSVQGFHAVMNLVLMPMWLLSGALFPPGGAPAWLQMVMRLNPLTYNLAALRFALGEGTASSGPGGPDAMTAWVVTAGFGLAMLGLAARMVGRAPKGGAA